MSEGDRQAESYRFDCVFYYVSDLDRAIAFYTNILGFRLASRDAVARFSVDGVLFELVPTTRPDVLSGQGNARLTLAVERIEAAVQDLRAKGVAVSDVRAVSNGRLASLKDADGNELVLWQGAARSGARPTTGAAMACEEGVAERVRDLLAGEHGLHRRPRAAGDAR